MPIEELTNEVVTQRCAVCQAVNQVPLPTLSIGVGSELPGDVDSRILRLPQCPTCKAQEFLIRPAEGQPPPDASSYAQLHGLLVSQLQAQLALAGRFDKRLIDLKVPPVAPDTLKQLFPDGLKLVAPLPEKPGP